MKKCLLGILLIALLLPCTACGQKAIVLSWQEQYDLGVRYLSESNYEEAIIAFTAAIEIDPKQAGAYLGLANVYIEQDDMDAARQILEKGYAETDSEALWDKLEELKVSASQPQEGYPKSERLDIGDGFYEMLHYNEHGFLVKSEQFDSSDALVVENVWTYDNAGHKLTRGITQADGDKAVITYDSNERPSNAVSEVSAFNWILTYSYEYTPMSSEDLIHGTCDDGEKSISNSLTYTMQNATHYIEVLGWNSSAGIDHIAEYEKSGRCVCSVRFNGDGSIASRVDY